MRTGLASVSALALVVGSLVPSLASAETINGLTADGKSLITFDSATPATFTAAVAISGLPVDVELLGIDVRPSTGVLYGLGEDSRLYTITAAGVATAVGNAAFTPALDYDEFVGFDFNNVSEGIRVATDTRQNLRLNATTGVATEDTEFTYANAALGVLRVASPIQLTGVAYTPKSNDTTSLFGIDSNNRELVIITGDNGNLSKLTPVPEPAAGIIGGDTLGIDPASDALGFDISSAGNAYVVAHDDGDPAALYSVALTGNTAGQVTKVADLSAALRDIAVAITPEEPDGGTSSSSSGDSGTSSSSSSSGSSGTSGSSSSGSSGASSSSSSGGSSSGRPGASSSSSSGSETSSGTSGAANDLGIDGIEGGGCAAAGSEESPWSAGAFAVAFGVAMAGLRRRNRR